VNHWRIRDIPPGLDDCELRAFFSCSTIAALFWVVLVLASPEVHAQRVKHPYESNFEIVRAILQQPESQMDLANIKLTIDKLIDPATDKAAVLKQLDDMTAEIRASFPFGASNLAKFKTLRDYLYQPPLLSGRRPFVYDLKDDLNPKAKLLSVYLATRKGNCISMPLLFVILGQKLEIPVTITTAPAHLYVKFRGDNGNWYGVETTSGGGWANDDWQKKQIPRLTDKAIANGIYLQPLTKKETAVVIADSLLEHYENQHSVEANKARVKLALLQIDHYPKNVVAMVHMYFGYRELRQQLFVERYPKPSDIPRELWPQFEQIEGDSMYWGNKAKSLGYMGSTPQMDAAYRERIRRARAGNEINRERSIQEEKRP
jgi:regulator of sirC expression with transglutaminase-like and TPR domain